MKKILSILWNLEFRFNLRGRAIFGKFLPLSYIISAKENRVDVEKIASILYVNERFIKKYKPTVINQKEIYDDSHIFLIKITYKKVPVIYLTYHTLMHRIDFLVNMKFFS